jgi:hypothetical protein
MLKRNRDTLFILFFPALITIVASALQRYPLRGRLVLFLAPFLAILMAEGIRQVFEMDRSKRLSAGVLFAVLLFLQPLADAAVNARYPEEARSQLGHSEEIRPVLWYIRDHWRDGDLIYVFSSSEDAFRYYSLLIRADFREVIIGASLRKDFENTYRKELDRLSGRGRVWVLRAGRGILDTRISDELLYSGGRIPMEEQGNDEEASKTKSLDGVQGEGGAGGDSRGQDAERIGRAV